MFFTQLFYYFNTQENSITYSSYSKKSLQNINSHLSTMNSKSELTTPNATANEREELYAVETKSQVDFMLS